jgi:hypothetical protein
MGFDSTLDVALGFLVVGGMLFVVLDKVVGIVDWDHLLRRRW